LALGVDEGEPKIRRYVVASGTSREARGDSLAGPNMAYKPGESAGFVSWPLSSRATEKSAKSEKVRTKCVGVARPKGEKAGLRVRGVSLSSKSGGRRNLKSWDPN